MSASLSPEIEKEVRQLWRHWEELLQFDEWLRSTRVVGPAESKSKVDNKRGDDNLPLVSHGFPESWPELRAKLAELTSAPGAKSGLARQFGVSRQVVSKWLGKGAPDANTTIQFLGSS